MPGDYATTARYGLRKLLGTSSVRDIDEGIGFLADDVDSKFAGYSEGPLGSRPPSSPSQLGIAGRLYRATDTEQVFLDTGTLWVQISRMRAAYSEVLTSQAQASAGPSDLATIGPQVTLNVPANTLVALRAEAEIASGATPGQVHLLVDDFDAGLILSGTANATRTVYTAPGPAGGTPITIQAGEIVYMPGIGAHTFKLQYATAGSAFANRRLWVRVLGI